MRAEERKPIPRCWGVELLQNGTGPVERTSVRLLGESTSAGLGRGPNNQTLVCLDQREEVQPLHKICSVCFVEPAEAISFLGGAQ